MTAGTKPPASSVMKQVRELDYDRVESEHRALLQVRMSEIALFGAVRYSRGDGHWRSNGDAKRCSCAPGGEYCPYSVNQYYLVQWCGYQMWSITVSLR
jgi:hypothetical protein